MAGYIVFKLNKKFLSIKINLTLLLNNINNLSNF
ncbi:uncharacterized protein FFFS_06303 [Fusarium fujikuroi]|nr:uncharacterized protein FFFS_06303 [Fusarium fujikuroi]